MDKSEVVIHKLFCHVVHIALCDMVLNSLVCLRITLNSWIARVESYWSKVNSVHEK